MKSFYLIFIFAALIDFFVLPFFAPDWLGRFVVSLLPFSFLFLPKRMPIVIFITAVILLWLTTSINLGIIVFSLGIMFLFNNRIVGNVFQKNTWQALIFSSFGVLIFGFFLALLSQFLTPNNILLNNSFIISFLLSSIFSAIFNIILVRTVYEKVI